MNKNSRFASFTLILLTLMVFAFPVSLWAVQTLPKDVLYPDGKVKEHYRYYLDDKQHEVREGPAEEFFPNGAKKGELVWEAGKENGLITYYYQDGRKSYEANYKEGKKNGFATVWYSTGQKQWQTVFRDGLTNGMWREWYPDGKKKFEANYNDGKLEGTATWWYTNGKMWQERSYQTGALVKGSVHEWDKSGKQTYPPVNDQETNNDLPAEPGKKDSAQNKKDAESGS